MQPKIVGLFVGLFLGLATALVGFGGMLICAFFGALGYVVMMVLAGEVDVGQFVGGSGGRRRT